MLRVNWPNGSPFFRKRAERTIFPVYRRPTRRAVSPFSGLRCSVDVNFTGRPKRKSESSGEEPKGRHNCFIIYRGELFAENTIDRFFRKRLNGLARPAHGRRLISNRLIIYIYIYRGDSPVIRHTYHCWLYVKIVRFVVQIESLICNLSEVFFFKTFPVYRRGGLLGGTL